MFGYFKKKRQQLLKRKQDRAMAHKPMLRRGDMFSRLDALALRMVYGLVAGMKEYDDAVNDAFKRCARYGINGVGTVVAVKATGMRFRITGIRSDGFEAVAVGGGKVGTGKVEHYCAIAVSKMLNEYEVVE